MPEEFYQKIFSKNLKYYLELNNKTQTDLINDLGFNKSAVSTWCNGSRLPRMDKVERLAQYFNINRSDLIEEHTTKPKQSKGVRIPVLGRVVAGIPLEAIEEVIDYEEISEQLASTGEFFCLNVKGDSMTPRICENDVVIVRRQSDAESGDLVIALVNGDEATVKRLQKYEKGIALIPINPAYEPLRYTNKDIKDKPVTIIGKVVESRRKY